jgi:peptide chain release factor 2
MADKDFWSDSDKAKRISKQAADLRSELETWKNFLKELNDLLELSEIAEQEGDESLHDEIENKFHILEKGFTKLEFHTLFSGKYDVNNAIVAIHAGSGGTEAQDWSEMLMRMIFRFAEKQEWDIEVLWESRGGEAGVKGITFRVSGRHAYGYLRSEFGVHRLVRISPFDAEKMRHTSFALIEVLPEIEEASEVEINSKDLRVDTYMSSGPGGQGVNTTYSAIRIVHIPTNIVVTCQNERSQQQNKETAMKILKSRLIQLEEAKLEDEKKRLRGSYQSAEWGNQIRSYVLHPYKMVKDHRSNHETPDAQSVLDGNLEEFIEAYLRYELGKSDRFEKANKDD